ncbi:hypothetical protein LJB98_02700 [Bacteroidales bacterium OttesenSCG-928-M11]|nr:hypothetical protein [Bacteroidales bacterium OttesenSCG-928-M11]
MNISDEKFDHLVEKIKKQQPVMNENKEQIDHIMQKIHHIERKKTSFLYLWTKRCAAAALICLPTLFFAEEYIALSRSEDIPSGMFTKIENANQYECAKENQNNLQIYHCYISTKYQEKNNIKQLINHFRHENNN